MDEDALYAKGRREAEAAIAAIMDEPVRSPDFPAAEAPRIGSTEWQAAETVKALLEQDRAKELLRRQREAEAAHAERFDPDADERRRWALQQAVASEPARNMGPDPGGEGQILPNGVPVLVTRDKTGLIESVRPAVARFEFIGPADWDRREAEERARERQGENELLSRHYGRDQCVAAGLFTEAEAREMDPERSRHVPPMRGTEGL